MSLDLADRVKARPWPEVGRVVLWPVEQYPDPPAAEPSHPFLVVTPAATFAVSPPMAHNRSCWCFGFAYRHDRLGD